MRQPLSFDCAGSRLVGVIRSPKGRPELGVVIVVGGPQYRIGSHRQFVQLAESLSESGVATLCFDFRGMGDSEGEPRSFEDVDDDIAAAIDALQTACPSVRAVVLWGLCGGASAALLYSQRRGDARVRGLALVNPWVRTDRTYAVTRVKHYYVKRLLERAFWRKLLGGGVRFRALAEFATTARDAFIRRASQGAGSETEGEGTLSTRMANAWSRFRLPILLVLSGNDYTAKEFLQAARDEPNWAKNIERVNVTRADVAGADHTFSGPNERRQMEAATAGWLARLVDNNA